MITAALLYVCIIHVFNYAKCVAQGDNGKPKSTSLHLNSYADVLRVALGHSTRFHV